MTQNEFFGGIESNLRRLKDARITLPDYNLPGAIHGDGCQRILRHLMRVKKLKRLTEKDPTAPNNIRVFDLVSGRVPGISRLKFRVFAAFVEEPTQEAYREVKFRLRKWYQESGWADAQAKPYAGAMVVGAAKAWPNGMTPNSDDLPFDEVEFLALSAPRLDPRQGVELATRGDPSVGDIIFRALGESFESQKQRVEDYVQQQFALPEEARDGRMTVAVVAGKTGVPEDDVSYIFNDFQGEGKLTVQKLKSKGRTLAESTFVVNKPPSFWRQLVSRCQGKWYAQSGYCTLLSLGTLGLLLHLAWAPAKDMVFDCVKGHVLISLCVVGGLAAMAGCLLVVLKFLMRNR